MLHQWVGVVLNTSMQIAFAILPAAPLLGQKLPSAADERAPMDNRCIRVPERSAEHI